MMNTHLMRLNTSRKQVFTVHDIRVFFLGVFFCIPVLCLLPALQEFLYVIPGVKDVFPFKESQHLFRDVWTACLENPWTKVQAARSLIIVIYPLCVALLGLILLIKKEMQMIKRLRQVVTVKDVMVFSLGIVLCFPLLCLGVVIHEAISLKNSTPPISEIWLSCFKRHCTETWTTRSLTIFYGGSALWAAILFLILPTWEAICLKDSTSSFRQRWQSHFNIFKTRILIGRFVGFLFLSIALSLFLICLMTSSIDALCSKAWPMSQTTSEITSSTTNSLQFIKEQS